MVAALLVGTGTPVSAAAREPAADQAPEDEVYRIDAIIIEGLFWTKPYVVMRELLFAEGERATKAEIEESIQRLRNLALFRIAEYELLDQRLPLPDGSMPEDGENHRILKIVVDERWTLIPFGTFSSGGGTFSLTTGLYTINLLGRYIQLGGQYQRFATTNSFAVWGADPRLFGERLSLSATIAQTNRINVFYDDDGELQGGHLRFRRSGQLSVNREWVKWFTTGVSLALVDDEYSLDLVPESIAELEQTRGLPGPARYLSFGLGATLGRINSNSYLREGARLSHSIAVADESVGSTISFVDTVTEAKAFLILPLRTNLGFRAGLGTTSVDREEYEFFVGGFSPLRGFLHRRFRGTHFWYGNGEVRIPSIDTRWLVLQHVGFVDASGIADGPRALRELDGLSSGIGIRILSPKVFSLIARVDYAWSIVGDGRSALSFGAGQFF
jgi:outer membrane protein assembly factor BamA